jgi:hypothetical protein
MPTRRVRRNRLTNDWARANDFFADTSIVRAGATGHQTRPQTASFRVPQDSVTTHQPPRERLNAQVMQFRPSIRR